MNIKEIQGSDPKKGDVKVLRVQIAGLEEAETRNNKKFLNVTLADASMSVEVKVWGDSPAVSQLKSIGAGTFAEVSASFSVNEYGLNIHDPNFRQLSEAEKAEFLGGSPEDRARNDAEFAEIMAAVNAMTSAPLKALCTKMLTSPQIQKLYRRAAAARRNHHARRGGLLAHSASMLRAARALCPCYGANIDLVSAGVIFHDLGKVVENDTLEGFAPVLSLPGEALGHIIIGIQMVNGSWKECQAENPALFNPAELTRVHLLHLIATHHGKQEYGSPVVPKTPEGYILHHVDMLDAEIEMVRSAYEANNCPFKGIYDAGWPLKGTLLPPLAAAKA
jgi:3'-5' exoribonuclease